VQSDVVFLVDISGSLELTGYGIHTSFMQMVVQGLNFKFGRTQVAYVTFSNTAQVRFYLNTYSSDLQILSAITIDSVGVGTDFANAFDTVRTQVLSPSSPGYRPEVAQKVIFLSDGKQNMDTGLTNTAVQALQATGAVIYTVSIGLSVQQDVMDSIASAPVELHTVNIPTRNDVNVSSSAILDLLCQ